MLIDFHIHTKYSDGSGSPEAIIKIAIRKGIRCIAFTDHNNCQAYNRAVDYIKKNKLENKIWILSGVEITCVENKLFSSFFYQRHLLLIGNNQEKLERLLKNNNKVYLFLEVLKWAKKNKFLVIVPHPNIFGGIRSMNLLEVMRYAKYIDVIEVHNGTNRQGYPSFIYNILHKNRMEIAKICHLPTMANSDAHMKFVLGRYFNTKILAKPKNTTELMKYIKNGKFEIYLR
jgi:predicted metal-dependent phosphoesterase TrpH